MWCWSAPGARRDETDPDVERELVQLAHASATVEIRPVATHHDGPRAFPTEIVRKAARFDLTSFDLPAAYGGGGIDSVRTGCLIGEELAWGDSPIGSIVGGAPRSSRGRSRSSARRSSGRDGSHRCARRTRR